MNNTKIEKLQIKDGTLYAWKQREREKSQGEKTNGTMASTRERKTSIFNGDLYNHRSVVSILMSEYACFPKGKPHMSHGRYCLPPKDLIKSGPIPQILFLFIAWLVYPVLSHSSGSSWKKRSGNVFRKRFSYGVGWGKGTVIQTRTSGSHETAYTAVFNIIFLSRCPAIYLIW